MKIEAFFKLTYGLYAICTEHDGIKNGYIGNTAFQVTSAPPQIAISCNKDNFSAGLIEKSGNFSISILEQETPADIIGLLGYKSGKDVNKFESLPHITGQTGVPILTQNTIAWFECKVVKTVDVGTHILFIGEMLDNDLLLEKGEPLTYAYYHAVKKGFAPKNAPTYIDPAKLEKQETTGLSKYKCLACGYIYDPQEGDPDGDIAPGTAFEDLPDDWKCPTCGSGKDMFEKI